MTSYPPPPWHLTADACLSLWRVPTRDVHPAALSVAGHTTVFTAWIAYREPGQLSYHELLAAVPVRGKRTTCTITQIWVDSEVSLAGGRELWAIPKDLADLRFTGRTFTAATGDDWIATAAFTPRPGPRLTLPTRFDVLQDRDGAPVRTPVGAKIRPRLAAADWTINAGGPLGYLSSRRPFVSLTLPGAELEFGV
ncbi:acetoacetate decarboxylase [Amycolatopsis balhimycina DSM 5908]|uniref:Acetoacetate decarboxylase n=1 Tax=Amycolatopsis balhimycina DSM 5908 TaxID=1081091 RepID=A0A428WU53_AMYBA|nr:acetoacetate decarboxylase family protein [Amycolatopsis balhimycina]RSM46624.1 acetoacetate decarboxylase [Amycolatopsis balhimycina DSM 5908]